MTYQIWQAPVEEPFVFRDYEFAQRKVEDFANNWQGHYEKVYEGDLDAAEIDNIRDALELLFHIFNVDHPKDYEARSLSVSDIVVLDEEPFYCDSFGWKGVE